MPVLHHYDTNYSMVQNKKLKEMSILMKVGRKQI